MNDLRILSKRSLNGRVRHVGSATIDRSLRSLSSKTSTFVILFSNSFWYQIDLWIFGRPYKLLVEAEKFVK